MNDLDNFINQRELDELQEKSELISDEQKEFIETLMDRLHFDKTQLKFMQLAFGTMKFEDASKLIEQLKTDADFYGNNPDFNTRQNQGNVLLHMEKLS
jgi:hypothetical protein